MSNVRYVATDTRKLPDYNGKPVTPTRTLIPTRHTSAHDLSIDLPHQQPTSHRREKVMVVSAAREHLECNNNKTTPPQAVAEIRPHSNDASRQ